MQISSNDNEAVRVREGQCNDPYVTLVRGPFGSISAEGHSLGVPGPYLVNCKPESTRIRLVGWLVVGVLRPCNI